MCNPKHAIALVTITIFSFTGCCGDFKQIQTPEGTLAVPECCPMVKYSGTSVSVTGVDLAIPKVPVKIGGITVEPKLIQEACKAVQILEQHRIFNCQMLPSYATISKAKFAEALDAMQKDEAILMQFALIVSTENGAAILKFVEYYGPQARYAQADMETKTTKGIKAAVEPEDVEYSKARTDRGPAKSYEYKTKDVSTEPLAEFEPSKGITVVPYKDLLQ